MPKKNKKKDWARGDPTYVPHAGDLFYTHSGWYFLLLWDKKPDNPHNFKWMAWATGGSGLEGQLSPFNPLVYREPCPGMKLLSRNEDVRRAADETQE